MPPTPVGKRDGTHYTHGSAGRAPPPRAPRPSRYAYGASVGCAYPYCTASS